MEDAIDWHERYQHQAQWTAALRQFLYNRLNLKNCRRILEVGCGTGVILNDLRSRTTAMCAGADIHFDNLLLATRFAPQSRLCSADALFLPYAASCFDTVMCHFLLLWVADPVKVLREMRRLTRPGGVVMVLAEPDYAGSINYPDSIAELGRLQATALRRKGADPNLGRRLAELFHQAGFKQVETGLLGGQWQSPPPENSWKNEWSVIANDLNGLLPAIRIEELRQLDQSAWKRGDRILFVPTFYAWGTV